jgi:23S rRNA (cytosine1962-C5)-methyltransferase
MTSIPPSDSGQLPSGSDQPARETAPGFGAAWAVIKPNRTGPLYARHPWVFDASIDHIEGTYQDGDVVEVVTQKKKFIARGIINARSRLRIRLYTWDSGQAIDRQFWADRIRQASEVRRLLGYDQPQEAARVVFGEADGLSGLVVDRYGKHLVVQVNSLAVATRIDVIVPLLVDLFSPQSVLLRTETGVAADENVQPQQGAIWGEAPDPPVFIEEHGLRYGVDLQTGQKTGFYLDQRENRRAAARYLGGRRVLDLFCFSGAFSLTASALGGASEVLGIDTSAKAIALARANAELNGISNVHFEQQDGFEALDSLLQQASRFQAIVLDPPKFTRTRKRTQEALRAYHRINRLALQLLEPGGILVTCSCSGAISREDFMMMLSGAAQKTGRTIQVLEQRGASPDHPISPSCPESEYLKCFICRVGAA